MSETTQPLLTDSTDFDVSLDKESLLREHRELKEQGPELVTENPEQALKMIRDWNRRAREYLKLKLKLKQKPAEEAV